MATILHTYAVQLNGRHRRLYLCSCGNRSLILVLRLPKKGAELPKWLLWELAACGPVMMLGIEFGWIFSCSGRQPWTIYGMRLYSRCFYTR
ncbi:cytochrome ubiquinol oxidase subunit I [Bacillus toyonensis]